MVRGHILGVMVGLPGLSTESFYRGKEKKGPYSNN